MGRIAETFAQRHADLRSSTPNSRRRRDPVLDLGSVPPVSAFVEQGLSQLHAHYAAAQHVASAFAEYAAEFPIVASFRDAVTAAEEEYLPSGPPMSPLTTSDFTTWALFDLRFGPDSETLAECLLRVIDTLELEPPVVEALRHLAGSRMGVYSHDGRGGNTGLVPCVN